jgi:sorbitol-6-phosphate 2-dehydrogenase
MLKSNSGNKIVGCVAGKTAIIIGGSRGIGEGIVRDFAKQGANIVIADIDIKRAKFIEEDLRKKYEKNNIISVETDVTNEKSVIYMVKKAVEVFNYIDILIYSAAVIKTGSVEHFKLSDFEYVTQVNYTGYFLAVKHVSKVMAKQHRNNPSRLMDIIQINSKSGIQGSKRNFAYSGSKFGGLGLTQSFALELWEDKIKVNAVCPGNVFDSPLWTDPEKGLFLKYLKARKVPGAMTKNDVKKYYESKIPMGKGCTIKDILIAIYYLIEQSYETGQSLVVTGGQIMR